MQVNRQTATCLLQARICTVSSHRSCDCLTLEGIKLGRVDPGGLREKFAKSLQ